MTALHPVDAPRALTGAKGDAWLVSLPGPGLQPPPDGLVVAVSTGRDSATILLGGVEGAEPRRYPGHDLALVLAQGSGALHRGEDPRGMTTERYAAPCSLVVPAGAWHAIVPDPGAPAGVAFFTRPGMTIDPFSVVGPRADPGLVHLDTLSVAPWPAVVARTADRPVPGVPSGAPRDPTSVSRAARVLPYAAPRGDEYSLPIDTGSDSVFVMTSEGRSWDRAPVDVPVHRHDREDEYIVLDAGAEGWLLNGPTPDAVRRIPFRGPCVLVMPAGNFHRVVRHDDSVVRSVLIYAHRSQRAGSWEEIVGEMQGMEGTA